MRHFTLTCLCLRTRMQAVRSLCPWKHDVHDIECVIHLCALLSNVLASLLAAQASRMASLPAMMMQACWWTFCR